MEQRNRLWRKETAAYQKLLCQHQLICSMSKKGDCYDNAAMESWNHTAQLKSKRFMVNDFKPDQMPSIKCSNILKCVAFEKGFTPNQAILARKLLKLKKSLN
jgi:transposase InsO family protein